LNENDRNANNLRNVKAKTMKSKEEPKKLVQKKAGLKNLKDKKGNQRLARLEKVSLCSNKCRCIKIFLNSKPDQKLIFDLIN